MSFCNIKIPKGFLGLLSAGLAGVLSGCGGSYCGPLAQLVTPVPPATPPLAPPQEAYAALIIAQGLAATDPPFASGGPATSASQVSPLPGITMDPDGTLQLSSSVPAGTYAVQVLFSNGAGTDTATAQITVTEALPAPVYAPQFFYAKQSLTFAPASNAGSPITQASFITQPDPSLAIAANGVISVTSPIQPAIFTFNVNDCNEAGCAEAPVSVTVWGPPITENQTLAFAPGQGPTTTPPNQVGGGPITAVAIDPASPANAMVLGAFGLQLDPTNGNLTGSPVDNVTNVVLLVDYSNPAGSSQSTITITIGESTGFKPARPVLE
jgi:hypothetical protein